MTAPAAPDEDFRHEIRQWLAAQLTGRFADIVGKGGAGREHEAYERRREWELALAEGGWIGIAWPPEHGGRGLSPRRQVIFHEEYAAAGGPGRVNQMGEQLLAPTLIAFGSDEQCARFLPGIRAGRELWCQGYSEPGAGSDLAGVRTKARLADDGWHIDGQKVWTSLAQVADWCFVLARSAPGSVRQAGLSYLLVPMRQPGIEVRPIVQLTGTAEFNEVFFDDARTASDLVVGGAGNGWRVAIATLAFERGVATLGHQIGFARELDAIVAAARSNAAIDRPEIAAGLVEAWIDLKVMRFAALRMFESGTPGPEASVSKLMWSHWHQRLGELAVEVMGPAATELAADQRELSPAQQLYLFSRADTIYGGSSEIQRSVVAHRLLGMPRETGSRS